MRCSTCDDEAIIFLHYANKHLCARHFIRMFEKRFRSTVREFGMLKKGERVAVGLSGGKDSTVLLHCLNDLKKDLPFELVAITIDEGISGYRAATLKIAKKEAKALGIEHHIVSFKKELGKTLDSILKTDRSRACSYCGVLRRGLLNRKARELKADKLAIGHNLDDIAQTVLMNIIRGEPSRSKRLLEPVTKNDAFIPRIRPLLRAPEKEVAIYAMVRDIGIDHRECPYAESALRQDIRRHLNELEEIHPGTKFKILSSFLQMKDEGRDSGGRGSESKTQDPRLETCIGCGEPCSGKRCKFCEMSNTI